MNKSLIKIVFTDLDGTLLNSSQKISEKDLAMLHYLGTKKIVRVLATGRNLYALAKVIPADFPVDYVIFSTGVGICDWKTKQIIHSIHLEEKQIREISDLLIKYKLNFMVQSAVPDNHKFIYLKNGEMSSDFQHRIEIYQEFAQVVEQVDDRIVSQFLTVFDDYEKFHHLKTQLKNVKVIRATSPLDHRSIWMEIFHKDVSKGLVVNGSVIILE